MKTFNQYGVNTWGDLAEFMNIDFSQLTDGAEFDINENDDLWDCPVVKELARMAL